jgi:SAM-dependent methyltransferase
MACIKLHQFRGRLGMGDLHPGGQTATEKILSWLEERRVRNVLEIGAGIGNTAARMTALGWKVTAIEPDPVLFERLCERSGVLARNESFLEHDPSGRYDAIIAESVFFMMDLEQSFRHAKALLEPGGHLAFVDALWTNRVSNEQTHRIYEETKSTFGIPVASAEPLTVDDWSQRLTKSGFEIVRAELLPSGAAARPPTRNRKSSAIALLKDPRLVFWMIRFWLMRRKVRIPGNALESWLFLARIPAV